MNLEQKINQILLQHDFSQEPFFVRLKDGSMSKDEFYQTQLEFYHAVVGFASPLSIVAARIPEPHLRAKIVKNIWEEHGEGDESKSHGETFKVFMSRLMGQKHQVNLSSPGVAVNLFNKTLNGIASNENYLMGVAMLGMIERMFADISSYIGMIVVERGWMQEEEMIHYSLHKELDCIHSEDFFSILRPRYDNSDQAATINTGLELGALIFLSFYQNLDQLAQKHD